MLIYLLPPSDVSKKYFTSPSKHMVGLFVDQSKVRKGVEEEIQPIQNTAGASKPATESSDDAKNNLGSMKADQTNTLQQDINFILRGDFKGSKGDNSQEAQEKKETAKSNEGNSEALIASIMSNPGLLAMLNNPNAQSYMLNPK